MLRIPSSLDFQWVSTGARWLNQHPVVSVLLLFVLPAALAYWQFVLRPYALVAQSKIARERIISPIMFGPLASSFSLVPPQRLSEDVGLAPFGQWLMTSLVLRGITAAELAKQLGCPAAAIHALMLGTPVGSHLPSAALVDAICAHLRLDPNEGRAAFFAIVTDSRPGSRST